MLKNTQPNSVLLESFLKRSQKQLIASYVSGTLIFRIIIKPK